MICYGANFSHFITIDAYDVCTFFIIYGLVYQFRKKEVLFVTFEMILPGVDR